MCVFSSIFRIYGAFDFSVRQYVIRDPEAYKQIAIKDFEHFMDHRALVDDEIDQLFSNNLLQLHGDKWKQMRSTLSPTFTGSKMRQMFELVSECSDDVVKHFLKEAEKGEHLNIEMKDFFSRYANDIIATCAFGIKVNSFADPDNEFFTSGKKLLDFASFGKILKFFVILMAPKIAKFFNMKLLDWEVSNSFRNIISDTMQTRQDNNIYRPDMINMVMEIRKGNADSAEENLKDNLDGFATVQESEVGKAKVTRKWNDDELMAQCFTFFLAGFDTSSSALTFAAYELVANQDVQQKLYEEIADVNKQLSGKEITYEVLQKMKYLDQVVSETLRKWPVAVQTDRTCVKDYVYDDGDKLKFKIEKGSTLNFSIYGLHFDPKYYPNPERFDPERFSDDNKHNITPGTYVPFGAGPRSCIGKNDFNKYSMS